MTQNIANAEANGTAGDEAGDFFYVSPYEFEDLGARLVDAETHGPPLSPKSDLIKTAWRMARAPLLHRAAFFRDIANRIKGSQYIGNEMVAGILCAVFIGTAGLAAVDKTNNPYNWWFLAPAAASFGVGLLTGLTQVVASTYASYEELKARHITPDAVLRHAKEAFLKAHPEVRLDRLFEGMGKTSLSDEASLLHMPSPERPAALPPSKTARAKPLALAS